MVRIAWQAWLSSSSSGRAAICWSGASATPSCSGQGSDVLLCALGRLLFPLDCSLRDCQRNGV